MSPSQAVTTSVAASPPRASGDEPYLAGKYGADRVSAPRERG